MVYELTTEQAAIVAADCHGPRLVDAGAGTGKTFTMVERARALIAGGMPPEALLIVTFTKAGANEIAGRLEVASPTNDVRRPTCGTFHAIAGDVLREFAYATGISPDLRTIDDARARGLFRRAFRDLEAGRLGVDLQSFPLLDRPDALEKSLAKIAMQLKAKGTSIDAFRATAFAQADVLETLPYGAITSIGTRGGVLSGWPKPKPARTVEERQHEAAAERRNIVVVAALLTRFQTLLDEGNLLTFGDVLHRATAMLLERDDIAARLRARWQHAIIDEFQDTNGTQIAFLEAIFGRELRPVMAVGDIRQCIFEFNGAEPLGFDAFRRRAIEVLLLGENRRSVQPILDLAHHAYDRAMNTGATLLAAALRAKRGHADPRVVRVQSFAGSAGRDREAAIVAADVRKRIDAGTSPRDIALLMRSRTRARLYIDAFAAQGIATQLVGGVGFFDAPEIREVIFWTRLAIDPTDTFALTAALQSAGINLGDGAVVALAVGGDFARAALVDPIPAGLAATEIARIERFRATMRGICALGDVPLVSAVRTIVVASGAEFARLGDSENAQQVRANLDQFIGLAASIAEDVPHARLHEFLADLDEREGLDIDMTPGQLPGERVTLSTIHGAKGLEWPHVYLVNVAPAAFPTNGGSNMSYVADLDDDGALALKHGVDGRPTLRWYCMTTPHDDDGNFIKITKSKDEERRLLYVAVTRARDTFTITGCQDRFGNDSAYIKEAKSWIDEVTGAPEEHVLVVEENGAVDAPPSLPGMSETVNDPERVRLRLSRITEAPLEPATRRGTLSYSAMEMQERCPRRARYHYVLGLPDFTDAEPPVWQLAEGGGAQVRDKRRFGSIVHKVLEYDAKARIAGAERDLVGFLADAVAEEGGTDAEGADAMPVAQAAIATLAAYEPIDAERHFALEIAGVKLGGYIDLIARDASGEVVVIDYKTGKTAADHYALQFALYARAVRESDGVEARSLLLRLADDGVTTEPVVPADDSTLAAAIAAARNMENDEPRPGIQCRYCPYAGDICRDAILA